ncbi:MAG: FecR domain-containing protein [Chryseolinea sp.]
MNHYRLYSPEQFALDKYFQEWALAPNIRSNRDWAEFLEQYPHKKETLHQAVELVRLTGLSTDETANVAFLETWQQIHQNYSHINSRRAMIYKVAAAVAGLMIIAFATYRFQSKTNDTILYTTGYGETKKITLEDGTSITLNAGSILQVESAHFNSDARNVTVDGDAFFEVVHTANNSPFIVHTNNGIEIHVHGTSFNVNCRNNAVKIYLQSGKIKLTKGNAEETLSPGDEASIVNGANTIAVRKLADTKAEDNLAWLKNQYVMNDVPLSVVADNIKETFGKVVISTDTSLLKKRVTARVPANDLKVLVEVLSQALEIKIEEKENRLYIRKAEIH